MASALRYASGKPAHQGDPVRVIDTDEPGYLRVIGQRGHVTVWMAATSTTRVYHITEIEPRPVTRRPR